ncbi:glycoside hydrolase family 99-like domain-containing protein, partial [uncultured Helicobacter sp.]|uniref:glycoside hydrolase family 99-like domain-containing protein n=1 Tax=uncultured Helicobacter sp. TaxID=175537 RepID=UPI002607BAAF
AFYLPQFYRVPENDEWWGEGFTEWTSVRGAEQLYQGHNQPRIPLNNNYYNLLEYNTMAWQAELMRKYRIDGMCIYHYWFENGKRILEKPAENLIKWTDINMPFCFCWLFLDCSID